MKFLQSKFYKNPVFWLGLLFFLYTLYRFSGTEMATRKVINISDFIKATSEGKVASVDMGTEYLRVTMQNGEHVMVAYPIYYSGQLINELLKNNVDVRYVAGEMERSLLGRLFSFIGGVVSWLPLIFIFWIWFSAFKGMGGGKNNNSGGGAMFGGGAFGFGRNKARMIRPEDLKVNFSSVAGVDEAKEDLKEIVDFLRDPQRYQNIGGKIPKGCLLSGAPGTGKTLLAKAIAAEAGVPFFSISGSDFVEMFVGVGASRVRDMFSQAKRHAPCIIFIDEIDAVGRKRGVGVGGGNEEREQTLNQLLVEMDGFEDNGGVVVIAATNRPDVLDAALTRPGRFDRQIFVSLPDITGREDILKVHSSSVKMSPAIDLRTIARGTSGFSGADLANLINEAALLAARRMKNIVTNMELEEARDKILMGSERKTLVMKKEERELTAYHEGGHALVAIMLPASDPVHKATIIPRGRALGLVMRLPEEDTFSVTRDKMFADLAVAMAGRVSEELIFGYNRVTSGASSDIEQATKMARAMVTKWGLSELVGTVHHETQTRDYDSDVHRISEATAQNIDSEIKRIVQSGYDTAKAILLEKMDVLHKLAAALLEFESLTGEEVKTIVHGGTLSREETVSPKRQSFVGDIPEELANNT